MYVLQKKSLQCANVARAHTHTHSHVKTSHTLVLYTREYYIQVDTNTLDRMSVCTICTLSCMYFIAIHHMSRISLFRLLHCRQWILWTILLLRNERWEFIKFVYSAWPALWGKLWPILMICFSISSLLSKLQHLAYPHLRIMDINTHLIETLSYWLHTYCTL